MFWRFVHIVVVVCPFSLLCDILWYGSMVVIHFTPDKHFEFCFYFWPITSDVFKEHFYVFCSSHGYFLIVVFLGT